MRAGRLVGICWLALGFAAIVIGVVVVLADSGLHQFGWFAYTPLDDARNPTDGLVFIDHHQLIGAAVSVVGMLIVASGLGYWLGRSERRP